LILISSHWDNCDLILIQDHFDFDFKSSEDDLPNTALVTRWLVVASLCTYIFTAFDGNESDMFVQNLLLAI